MEDKDLEKPEAAEETEVQPENGRAFKEEPEKEKKELTPEEMAKKKEVHCDSGFCAGLPGSHVLNICPHRQGKRNGSSRKFRIQCERAGAYHCKLVDKKTAAYEKQQAEVEEESRMKSLEQLAGTLMNNGKSSDTGEKEKDGDRLQQSVNTYEQISRQLDDFYETPKETANSDLERKVDELNKKLEKAEKEKNKAATREELMERSYKMAAKYLNPDKDTIQQKVDEEELPEVVPVQRAEHQTTSGLSQSVTDSAFVASLTVERNYGFNTAVGSSYQMGTNTIAACISESQTIEQGGRVKLRLLQPLQAGSITVPENSLVTGAAVIQGERLDILISSIEYAGNIIPVQLATYDIDGQKGIFVPGSETRNAAKDAAGTVSESMGNSVSFARSAGQQVVMDLTRGVMQGGTRLIAGRVRAVKVTLKAGYKVLLVTKKQ